MADDANAIKAGSAFVELFLRDKLTAGLVAASDKVQAFGDSIVKVGGFITALGAAVTAPLIAAVTAFAQQGAEMLRLSQVTGTSVEALSTLGFAFSKVGGEAESLNIGLVHMQAFLSEAIHGGKEAQEELARLGLSLAQLRSVPSDEKFRLIAAALAKIADETEKVAAARKIFGRGGAELLPLINLGDSGIRSAEADVRALGLVMTTEAAQASREFLKSINALAGGFKGAWFVLSQALLPILAEVIAPLRDLKKEMILTAGGVARWITENKELVGTVFKVGAGLVAAGAAIVTVGVGIKAAGLALAFFTPLVSTAGAALGGLVRIGASALTFLTTPLGLLTAVGIALTSMGGAATVAGVGILGLVVVIKLIPVACAIASAAVAVFNGVLALFTGGVSLVPALIGLASVGLIAFAGYMLSTSEALKASGQKFQEWKGIATDAIDGIRAAIQVGDFARAFRILGLTIELGWTQIINGLKRKWSEFTDWMLAKVESAVNILPSRFPPWLRGFLVGGAMAAGVGPSAIGLAPGIANAVAPDAAERRQQQQEARNQAAAAEEMTIRQALDREIAAAREATANRAPTPPGAAGIAGGVVTARTSIDFAERGSVKAFEIISKVQGDKMYSVANQQLRENRLVRELMERLVRELTNGPVVARANI